MQWQQSVHIFQRFWAPPITTEYHRKNFCYHRIPPKKNFATTEYPEKKFCYHRIPPKKNFATTKSPRENDLWQYTPWKNFPTKCSKSTLDQIGSRALVWRFYFQNALKNPTVEIFQKFQNAATAKCPDFSMLLSFTDYQRAIDFAWFDQWMFYIIE